MMKYFRTIMTVRGVDENSIYAMSAQWSPYEEFSFNKILVPMRILEKIEVGGLLLAEVNLDAEKKEDLRFCNFELPDPDILKEIT